MPEFGFPGLLPGDCWCLCGLRWKQALFEGKAPPVVLSATHINSLQINSLDDLLAHATLDDSSDGEMQ